MTKFKKQPRQYNPMKDLLDEELVAQAVWECLEENDFDGVIEVLEVHMSAKTKPNLSKGHYAR